MNKQDGKDEIESLHEIISILNRLESDVRQKILKTVATFFRDDLGAPDSGQYLQPIEPAYSNQDFVKVPFGDNAELSPKEFLLEKQPRTDVERIACLAFYLTHFRGQQHFKTVDLSRLNTEAAQPKFANTANAASNAVKRGYLVPGAKNQRQLSAAGEQFVLALPDRDAARKAMAAARPRRRPSKRTAGKK